MDYNSKDYQKFVLEHTIKEIQKDFNLTKKEATQYFYKALAYNTTQAEIAERINSLIANNE